MSEQAERASGLHAASGIASGIARVGYAPITRVDAERREIELCATSEALDAHGTIFDYAASKEAFTRWLGNVREMHERRAVGRRVAVRCDDDGRRVYVRLRISRGAQDTWEKVLDGTLRGASIGASDVVWRRERRSLAGRSRWVNVATRYDLAELSLVDNPSNPDALGVTFVRGATPDLTLLDPLEPLAMEEGEEMAADDARAAEMAAPEMAAPEAAVERERQPLHEAARALLTGCGCPLCAVALAALADDAQMDDAHGEGGKSGDKAGGESDAAQAGALTRALAAGLRVNAERMAQFDGTLNAAVAALHQQIERMVGERLEPSEREPGEQAGQQAAQVVEELRARVARLEAQPVAGGPAARAVEKTLGGAALGLGGMSAGSEPGAEFRALEALAGRLRDPQAQLAVAAEMIRLQQRAGGE